MQSILWLLYIVAFSWIRKVTLYTVLSCTSCINYSDCNVSQGKKTYCTNLNDFTQELPKTQHLIQISLPTGNSQ